MDSRDNVILFWRPGWRIIQNKWWLLKSHMAHARCVKFLKMHRLDNPLFNYSITHEIRMFTCSFWMNPISMFCSLLMIIQSATCFGTIFSAMYIGFGSLMNCISCSSVLFKAYCTWWSNTWKAEMWRINVTINSQRYHDIRASSASLNHSIRWKSAPGRVKRCRAWSER